MANKRFTLDEIGKLANVSRATVSRVINNYPHIRPEVRERVLEVIKETGYQPNLVARSLVSRRSNILGLIIPSTVQKVFADPYFPRLIQGVSQACNAQEYTLSLFLFHDREEERKTLDRILGTGLVDGLVVTADYADDVYAPELIESTMPFVQIGRPESDISINFVDVENKSGGYLATRHLIQQGYRKIGIIASNINGAGIDRLSGYQRALAEQNIPFDEALVQYGDYGRKSGYDAMQALLALELDAVFACSDSMALGAIQVIKEAGLTIPDDIAVVGFDNLVVGQDLDPPLTTIHQPIKRVGAQAIELLIAILDGEKEEPQQVILPVELIVRGSCGG